MKITKEHILSEIRRTSRNGVAPGIKRFQTETGIKLSAWYGRFWTRWNDAVSEAGLEPNTKNELISEQQLLNDYVSLIQELGHFPTDADIKIKRHKYPNFPSINAFYRLGKKCERAHRVIEFCGNDPNLAEVVEITLLFLSSPSQHDVHKEDQISDDAGYVYLLKSGKYYKIGRSKCAERRTYEIQLQLPEKAKLIHKISTDDPVGIEKYWHERFADKRTRGEWFKLTPQDVKTFRRRKFM